MRVMDLPGSVPQRGGALVNGDAFPLDAKEAMIEGVSHVMEKHVLFTCIFRGKTKNYDFRVSDKTLAEKIAKILSEHRGKTLLSIGDEEVPS